MIVSLPWQALFNTYFLRCQMINWKKNKRSLGTKHKNKEWEEELILSLTGGGGVGWGHRGWCRKAIYNLCSSSEERGCWGRKWQQTRKIFLARRRLLARMKNFSFSFEDLFSITVTTLVKDSRQSTHEARQGTDISFINRIFRELENHSFQRKKQ